MVNHLGLAYDCEGIWSINILEFCAVGLFGVGWVNAYVILTGAPGYEV